MLIDEFASVCTAPMSRQIADITGRAKQTNEVGLIYAEALGDIGSDSRIFVLKKVDLSVAFKLLIGKFNNYYILR